VAAQFGFVADMVFQHPLEMFRVLGVGDFARPREMIVVEA
jgi:hypothetical protein